MYADPVSKFGDVDADADDDDDADGDSVAGVEAGIAKVTLRADVDGWCDDDGATVGSDGCVMTSPVAVNVAATSPGCSDSR